MSNLQKKEKKADPNTMADKQLTCPLCNSPRNKALGLSLLKCNVCKTVYNINYQQLSYDSCYFLDDYQKQYGKTYEEDFQHIYCVSKKRLHSIYNILNMSQEQPANHRLLDIGCAMGFFLKCAQDLGINDLTGIEISRHAVQYCRDKYKFTIINTQFEKAQPIGTFDIITSWFFIEHLAEPLPALQKIFSLLNPGGIFACAIPSSFGPLFYLNKNQWIASHPKDHRIDFSPRSAIKTFSSLGFRKVITRPAAIHPERVLNKTNLFYKPFSKFYTLFSQTTSFSDTLEIYAIK